MILKNKFAIGCLVQWYEIDLIGEYIESLKQSLYHIDNKENVYVDFVFTVNQDNLIKVQETFHTGTDQTPVNMLVHQRDIDFKLLPYEFNMNDMTRKEILGDDLLFTKIGWIYQYNAIPNNKDNQLTNYFMKKTYEHFYGELND